MTTIAERIRSAFANRDFDSFGELVADDARWGDDDHPNRCRGRRDVLANYRRLVDQGVTGDVAETKTGPAGVMCELRVEWPGGADRSGPTTLFQVFLVRDGRIVEIRGYDDRESAFEAIRD
jgi:ketosteroid isomerase-like protein